MASLSHKLAIGTVLHILALSCHNYVSSRVGVAKWESNEWTCLPLIKIFVVLCVRGRCEVL